MRARSWKGQIGFGAVCSIVRLIVSIHRNWHSTPPAPNSIVLIVVGGRLGVVSQLDLRNPKDEALHVDQTVGHPRASRYHTIPVVPTCGTGLRIFQSLGCSVMCKVLCCNCGSEARSAAVTREIVQETYGFGKLYVLMLTHSGGSNLLTPIHLTQFLQGLLLWKDYAVSVIKVHIPP